MEVGEGVRGWASWDLMSGGGMRAADMGARHGEEPGWGKNVEGEG